MLKGKQSLQQSISIQRILSITSSQYFQHLEKEISALYLILDSSGADFAMPETENITLSLFNCSSIFFPIGFSLPKYFLAVCSVRIIELAAGNGLLRLPCSKTKSNMRKNVESTIRRVSLKDCSPVFTRLFKFIRRQVDSISG